MIAKWTARPLVAALILCSTALAAHGATITVTKTGTAIQRDGAPAVDGQVTLREAIQSINNGADLNGDVTANRTGTYGTSDTINFAYSGGGVIQLDATQGTLTVTKTVDIEGYTESAFLIGPGTYSNSAVTGNNSNHTVLISGGSVGFTGDCLAITGQTANGTVVRGVVFDSCPGSALSITNSQNNVIAGDFFGTDSAGNFAASAGNATGVSISAAIAADNISGNQLGGPNPADRNVISGNTSRNILIFNNGGTANNIIVQNNYVGLNAAGTTTVTGNGQGMLMSDLQNATIGGASGSLGGSCHGVCNLFSGNGGAGIQVGGTNATGNVIQGNFFGSDVTGTLARGNNASSIDVSAGTTLTIGGTAAGTGNLFVAAQNQGAGILVDGGVAGPVNIQGNYIGTNTSGNAPLGNTGPGIHVVGSTNVNIGGTAAGARNVIGGNGTLSAQNGPGILMEGNAPFSTATATIQGNSIGVGADGSTNVGNLGDGIDFITNASGSTVGAVATGGAGGNIIAFNGIGRTNGAGVGVAGGSTSNKIFSNSIFGNTGSVTALGIDLSASGTATDGPTANDNCDPDAGGNNLQNFPLITSAQTNGSNILITGTLNSVASTAYTIEFFSNGSGTQARTYLGSTIASTSPSCAATFSASLATAVAVGQNITATATDPLGNTSEISAAVAAIVAPPTVTKSFNPTSIGVNGTSTITITLSNPSTNPSTGAAITDTYPAGLVNATPSNVATTCGGTATAANGGGSVALTGGTIPAGGSCTITVDVTSAAANSYVNTTGNVSGSEGTSLGGGTATLTVLNRPTISKVFAPTSIPINGTSTLTITLSNSNSTPLTSATFTDTYPSGLINATPSNVATTCGGTATAANGGGSVALTGGTIPAAGSCTVTVNVTSASANSYNNIVIIGALTTANAGSNPGPATATLDVLSPPTVTKNFSPNPIAANGTSTLTVTLSNANGAAITGAAFTDNYPAGLVNATPSNVATTCGGTATATNGGTSLALTGGTIPASGSCTVTVSVTSPTPGTYANSIGVSAVTTTNAGSNTAAANASLTVNSPLTVAKTFTPPAIAPGGTSQITITLTNPNSVVVTGAAFTDTYPAGLTNAATPAGSTTCGGGTVTAVAGGGTVALSGGTVPASGSCTVTVTVTASVSASYPNTIAAGDVTTTNAGANTAPASATLIVTTLSAPTVTKSFSPGAVAPAAASVLTITLANANGTAITGVGFVDTYPSGLVNFTTPAASSSCGGVVTAAAGGGSLTLSGGSIPALGTCTVTVSVSASAGGSYLDTIPAGGVTSSNAPPSSAPASATLLVTSNIPALSPAALAALILALAALGFTALRKSL